MAGRHAEPPRHATTASRTRASTTCPSRRRRSSSPASAPRPTRLAARIGDGFCTVAPDRDAVERFRAEARRRSKLVAGGMKVCWAPDEQSAREHRAPAVAERRAARRARADPADARALRTGRRARRRGAWSPSRSPAAPTSIAIADAIRDYEDAGFDELYVQQVGGRPRALLRALRQRGAAALSRAAARRAAAPARSALRMSDDTASVAILDIDGTLVDTNYQHALAWYRAFRRARRRAADLAHPPPHRHGRRPARRRAHRRATSSASTATKCATPRRACTCR